MDELLASSVRIFGRWRFDNRLGELCRRDGAGPWAPVAIGARAAAILAALLREPGALVSKDTLMDEAWPSTTVEANNLTVQIAALRRVLDDGRAGDSLIQTVAGRGYRFVGAVGPPASVAPHLQPAEATPTPSVSQPLSRARRRWVEIGVGIAVAVVLLIAAVSHPMRFGRANPPPRMSLVVLPFQNLGGNSNEDYLADAVTDDLVARMSMYSMVPGIVRSASKRALDGIDLVPDAIGRTFDVRYMLRGSVRKLGAALRVNAQLASTETGDTLWTDQFDASIANLGAGQQEIARRISLAAEVQMIVTEDLRSRRERPDDPDALDLVVRAGALSQLPPSAERLDQMRGLFEQAVQRDPSLEAARFGLANMLLDGEDGIARGRKTVLERTRALLVTIRSSQPGSWAPMATQLHWLSWQVDRCPETIDLGTRFIAAFPEFPQVYRWVGDCQTRMGQAEEALSTLQEAYRRDEGLPWQSHDDRNLQYALLLLGRYDESIVWGRRALAANPEDMAWERSRLEFRLAAADALAGRVEAAEREVADGVRLRPGATLREFAWGQQSSPIYAAQLAPVIEGLRQAGLRDHADADADFGVAADDQIHQDPGGRTPSTAQGAETIGTDALAALLAREKPVVIDTLAYFAGRSIPGAVGLSLVGAGGDVSDVAQDHLRSAMGELTHDDLRMPVVAMGWNSENFGGRNLALRLAALGYTRIYWYRGGREAWEVEQRPEAELTPTEW